MFTSGNLSGLLNAHSACLDRTDSPGNPYCTADLLNLKQLPSSLVAREALHEFCSEHNPSYMQVLPRVEFNWRTEAQTEASKKCGR
jgi:hypothetical protein